MTIAENLNLDCFKICRLTRGLIKVEIVFYTSKLLEQKMYFIQSQNKVHFIYKVHFLESEHYTLNSDESRVYPLSREKYKIFQF